MQVQLPPRADRSAAESPGLSVAHATPAMQEHSHHGSCLTIAFSGRPRLRSVLGTTSRKAAAQDVIDPVPVVHTMGLAVPTGHIEEEPWRTLSIFSVGSTTS